MEEAYENIYGRLVSSMLKRMARLPPLPSTTLSPEQAAEEAARRTVNLAQLLNVDIVTLPVEEWTAACERLTARGAWSAHGKLIRNEWKHYKAVVTSNLIRQRGPAASRDFLMECERLANVITLPNLKSGENNLLWNHYPAGTEGNPNYSWDHLAWTRIEPERKRQEDIQLLFVGETSSLSYTLGNVLRDAALEFYKTGTTFAQWYACHIVLERVQQAETERKLEDLVNLLMSKVTFATVDVQVPDAAEDDMSLPSLRVDEDSRVRWSEQKALARWVETNYGSLRRNTALTPTTFNAGTASQEQVRDAITATLSPLLHVPEPPLEISAETGRREAAQEAKNQIQTRCNILCISGEAERSAPYLSFTCPRHGRRTTPRRGTVPPAGGATLASLPDIRGPTDLDGTPLRGTPARDEEKKAVHVKSPKTSVVIRVTGASRDHSAAVYWSVTERELQRVWRATWTGTASQRDELWTTWMTTVYKGTETNTFEHLYNNKSAAAKRAIRAAQGSLRDAGGAPALVSWMKDYIYKHTYTPKTVKEFVWWLFAVQVVIGFMKDFPTEYERAVHDAQPALAHGGTRRIQ